MFCFVHLELNCVRNFDVPFILLYNHYMQFDGHIERLKVIIRIQIYVLYCTCLKKANYKWNHTILFFSMLKWIFAIFLYKQFFMWREKFKTSWYLGPIFIRTCFMLPLSLLVFVPLLLLGSLIISLVIIGFVGNTIHHVSNSL